ncbi:MAG TPA: hypothetical protein VFL77_08925 [Solirubrobacterales bacterium]|nr:hypothetical protein [Solirubrobacterales bacterium]
MPEWPPISEPELLARLALPDDEFKRWVAELARSLPVREFEPAMLERALGYPWERPAGSYEWRDGRVRPFAELGEPEREELVERYTAGGSPRLPLLAIGSNAAPEVLERKFGHFRELEERAVLALSGHLHGFDIGAAAQPTLYGSMPATPFESPGTAVAASVLWVTPGQFTQLTWSELTYHLGRLHTRFEIADAEMGSDDVLVFVSRFGTFCVEGEPAALAAVPAQDRSARAFTQRQLLDHAAALALGPGADAETLLRAICADLPSLLPKVAATVRREAEPLRSERWIPFEPEGSR